MICFGFLGKTVDIEIAFLYGDLEELIYIECPPGMRNMTNDDFIILETNINGLVQAARQHNKKAVHI